jgi:hypothetical protein
MTVQHRGVLEAIFKIPPLPDLLAVFGAGMTVIGGIVGWFAEKATWRRSLENLSLGAAAGGVCGFMLAFLAYSAVKLVNG